MSDALIIIGLMVLIIAGVAIPPLGLLMAFYLVFFYK
jgi:hypothetical protein